MDFNTGDRIETELCRETIGFEPHWYEAPLDPKRFSINFREHLLDVDHERLTCKLADR